jgi:hypothetical protein
MDEINKDFAKMITEQYQKQITKKNAKMEELPDNPKMGNMDQQVAPFM